MRLTKKVEDNAAFHVCQKTCLACNGTSCGFTQAIVDRLAAYEDTGFEPEEVAQMGNALKLQSVMVNEASHYWNLQQQGMLVILPCKVGDTLYAPTRNIVSEFRVSHIDFGGYEKPYLWVEWYLTKGITGNFRIDGIKASEIGKTVFLTREEAEAALKGETEDV